MMSNPSNANPESSAPVAPAAEATVLAGSETTGSDTASFRVEGAENTLAQGGATQAPKAAATQVVGVAASAADLLQSADPQQALGQPITLGDFEVVKKLGQGGMGAVFKARQLSLERDVALKVLARHLADNQEFVARFYREARVMARLDHENIIRCYSVGSAHGLHYLAMEFVDGGSLHTWLDKLGKFSVGDAVRAALDVARGLQHAHEQGLIHRDIKPDNALISHKGVVKVADLGLAKPQNDDLGLTATGVGAGTPLFMAPEQMQDAKNVDARADIYALGCMLYVMVTGERPFKGGSLVELIKEKEAGKFTSARRLNPKVPDRLDLMIDKMMDKNPRTRYQTCAELIRDLESLGIANATLSFLEPGGATSPIAPAGPSGAVTKPDLAGGAAKTQAPARTSPKEAPATPKPKTTLEDVWYISIGQKNGKRQVKKMTTFQVMDAIHAHKLDGASEASREVAAGYRALMTYPEFQKLLQMRGQKAAVKVRTVMTTAEQHNISKEALSHIRWRWLRRLGKNLLEWIYLILGLGAIALVGLLIYLNWEKIQKIISG
jgi:serine/threonine protein kinase